MRENNNLNSFKIPQIQQSDNYDSQIRNKEERTPYLRWFILGFLLFVALGAVSYLYIFQYYKSFYLIYLNVNSNENQIHLNNVFIYSNIVVPLIGGLLVSTIGGILVLITSVVMIVLAATINFAGINDKQYDNLYISWWIFSVIYVTLLIATGKFIFRSLI